MSDSSQNRATELVEQGANALKVGNTAEAYAALREAVKLEPNNERAWLWLAGAVPSDDQRRFCLERVLQLNPENTAAKRGLVALPAPHSQPAVAAPAAPAPKAAPAAPLATPPSPRSTAQFDPLAQSVAAKPTPPRAAEPTRAEPSAAIAPTWAAPVVSAQEPLRIDGPQPSRNSLELLQREQQDHPAPSGTQNTGSTTRPSFVKPRLGKESKSDPKVGNKPSSEQHTAASSPPSMRPNIPISEPGRLKRGTLTLIGLGLTLVIVLGLIAFLIVSELNARSQQAMAPIPTESPATEPTAALSPEATSVPNTPIPDTGPLLAQARTLAESGNHEQAIEIYSKVLAITDNADAFFERGNSHLALNQNPDAIGDFSAALRLRPGFAEAYENRGRTNLRINNFRDSISDYTEALRLNPNNPTSFLRRGIAYQQSTEYTLAQADFTSAIQLKADYIEAYLNRGDALRKQGDFESAVIDYNAALKLKPEYIPALLGRGNTEIDAKRFRAGLEDCSRAATADPNIPEPYFCRGRAYTGLKQYQQALDDFGRSLELNPDQPDVLHERGRTQLLVGEKQAARDDFELAASLYEQFGDTKNLAIVRAELEQLK